MCNLKIIVKFYSFFFSSYPDTDILQIILVKSIYIILCWQIKKKIFIIKSNLTYFIMKVNRQLWTLTLLQLLKSIPFRAISTLILSDLSLFYLGPGHNGVGLSFPSGWASSRKADRIHGLPATTEGTVIIDISRAVSTLCRMVIIPGFFLSNS